MLVYISLLLCLVVHAQSEGSLHKHRARRQEPVEEREDQGEVSLTCTGESMTVTLNTGEPFTGRLFSQSAGRECQTRGTARTATVLTFSFEDEEAERCGMERIEGGAYSMVVVVQHHPVIQRSGDRAVQLFCYFDTGVKVVTNGYDVLADTIDGGTQISTPSSILNSTAPSPGVRLRITTSTGEDISGTRLGEKLFLRIEMDRESIFGIFAKSLKAISGADDDSIELLDSRGCPTDPIIFPGLEKIPGSRDLQGRFEAFKFSDTSVVRFQVNVQFCVDECNPVECGDGLQSYGRRKRSPDSLISHILTVDLPPPSVPESFASRLVYDDYLGQEVLYSDTPLSKEIYVESGTTVDRFRDPRFKADNNGVFIWGANEDEEVVCTTWPVIIATGAAVIFLQLCIISTCLLCLCTSRRSKPKQDRMSDHHSLYSGSSSSTPHPPPATLYHDQLTYRPPPPPSSTSRVTDNSASTLKSLRTSLRD
eukprot:TRINITY_DN4919_c0_g1_i2.p1 TRINITY_DN4919_c0_g1~~TRINITY_DN4919_c0_g1_i2.p1  ORF type:complete len:480 (-),score=142.94 TRINITY_DN4919_c0_g1_i2:269-1708(-)